MSESIENQIKEINDIIKAEIEGKRIGCELDEVDGSGVYLRVSKINLVDAEREEYKNDTKTRL